MPTVNRNGQTLYQPDKPFGDVRAVSVNGRIFADAADGTDMGAKINAAITSQAGKPNTYIETAPNMVYVYTTPIVYPSRQVVDLECHGSTLRYTGTDLEGIKVLSRNGGPNTSGGFHHCRLEFATPSSHIRWESSTFFHWDRVTISFESGLSNGVDMVNVNSAAFGGGGGYFEENLVDLVHINAAPSPGSCAITMRHDPSLLNGGSFFYDRYILDADSIAGTSLICTQTSHAAGSKELRTDGSIFLIHLNGGGSAFNIAANTSVVRGTVVLAGECNTGPCNAVTVHSTGTFHNDGTNYATGWPANDFQDGAFQDQIIFGNGLDGSMTDAFPFGGTKFRASESYNANREELGVAKLDGNYNMFLLANHEGTCSEITNNAGSLAGFFRIQQRETHFGFPVEQDNKTSSYPRYNLMDATPVCHGLLFGKGFHDQSAPAQYPSNTFGTPDITAHALTVISNTPATGKTAHEFGVKDKPGGSAIVEYTLNQSLYEDDNKGHAGTAFTGDCAPAATIHVVNGRIVGCN